MGKALRNKNNGSSYGGRAVMTGPLLKLPLIHALQPIEEQRRRHCAEPQHPCVLYAHTVLSNHFIYFTCFWNNTYSHHAFVCRQRDM